ncbi:hypothetical protein F8M41_000955 [Gigaspora margarita]|uniref:DUF202 domain-containing protein n=1 Tax=Gigaspora margarita TaxID=4874 RepID=A0A8H3XHL3_GIGMA|nr:hypothetical protein F8M41_000955 [Gigaspora margarita]
MIELEKQIKSLLDIDADTESQPFTEEEVMKMSSLKDIEVTFGNAYWTTSLTLFMFLALVLKIFDHKFFNIGLVFVSLSSAMLFIALHRRRTYLKRLKDKSRLFITNGKYVLLIGFLFMSAYIILLVMIATLEKI